MLLLAILLLLAAAGLLAAAIRTGQIVLAWGSIGLSVLVVLALLALLRRARRRHREAAEADPDAALDDENDVSREEVSQEEVVRAEADPDDAEQVSPQPPGPSSETPAEPAEQPEGAEAAGGSDIEADDTKSEADDAGTKPAGTDDTGPDDTEPDEEDTDAADLLVVWELSDEVLVVDEHPRYHLARCSWPGAAATERLPVQEARELGFTPCAQCRPDAALARKRRAALAKQDPAKQDPEDTGTGREPGRATGDQGEGSGGQDSDSSAVLG